MLELKNHLSSSVREQNLTIWDDGEIIAGQVWDDEILDHLEDADIVVFLLSSDFTASQYIWTKEVPRTLKREQKGQCRVVPVMLRPCDYDQVIAKHAMLPKNDINDIYPVDNQVRRNRDDAFLSVVNGIKAVVTDIRKKYTNRVTLTGHGDGISVSLGTIWQDIPLLEQDWGLLRTVDCDRDEDYTDTLLADFLEKENDDCNLVYFISACETQNPESVSKRLVYDYGDVFTTYPASTEHEILVQDLKIERRPEETWIHFWRVFNESFSLNHPDFDDFILHSNTFTKSHKRIPFFCTVKEHHWTRAPNLEAHLQLIIERFSTLPTGCHKFVLFFILEFEKLHDYYQNTEARCNQRLQKIARIALEETRCTVLPHIKHIILYRLVEEESIIVWLKGIIDRRKINLPLTLNNVVSRIIEALVAELDVSERKMYEERKVFNMQRLEMMQRHIYNHIIQLKNHHLIA